MNDIMNRIYNTFYHERLFTLREANKIIKNYQVCKNTISRLQKKGLIKRVRSGLYYIIPIDDPQFYPDPIHVATKLRENGVMSCNSSFTVLKCLAREKTIYLSATHSAKMRVKDITFRLLKQKHLLGTLETTYSTTYATIPIKVSDLEKTIIDCLWNRTMQIEQLITVLKYAKTINHTINPSRMLSYLEKIKKPILYHKTGFVLDTVKEYFGISEDDLEAFHKKLSSKKFYFKEKGLRLTRPRYMYIKRWKVMIPEQRYIALFPKATE